MKKLLALTTVLFLAFSLQAQYTVTKVVGNVKNLRTGEQLKTGSKMLETDKLKFSGNNDLVRLIILGKGAYVLQPNPKNYAEENTILEILKSSFHLNSKEGYLSGRAGNFEKLPDCFETEADRNEHVLIEKENAYLFDTDQFPIEGGSRFFLQITVGNQPPQLKTLTVKKDTLIILATDFGDAQTQAATVQLGYYSAEENSSKALISFKPYFAKAGELEDLMSTLIKAGKGLPAAQLEKEVYKEVYEALGKPGDISFSRSFKKMSR